MTVRKKRWLIGTSVVVVLLVTAFFVALSMVSKRFEPYIRDQVIAYLSKRFNSDVHFSAIHIRIPYISPWKTLREKGRGTLAQVEGDDLVLRHKGRTDIPPMLTLKRFRFSVDLGAVFDPRKTVKGLVLDGLEIYIPPKGERPEMGGNKQADAAPPNAGSNNSGGVTINEIIAPDAVLVILPVDKTKTPLRFDIHYLRLESAAKDTAMQYEAVLRNPKPSGEIRSKGTFGPWNSSEPGDTPLKGDYTFAKADLSVFKAIAGILNSTGSFEGTLSSVNAHGQATVNDFRLKSAGNPVPLSTTFEVLVDGTNGNTVLKPVHATLGQTKFVTSGAVIKHEGDVRRTVTLDVNMPAGRLEDLLRLAMKGSPFMTGQINMMCKIGIPPLTSKVKEKLLLDGKYTVSKGQFLKNSIQDKVDSLSRRGQGQPKNEEIDEVFSQLSGKFHLEDQVIRFSDLSFGVPGADVALAGDYNMGSNLLDFHGTLKLQAKVSQTMTGWKRWLLKPVDPIFAKNGAGTFLRIKVDGPSSAPKFGLDRSKQPPPSVPQ